MVPSGQRGKGEVMRTFIALELPDRMRCEVASLAHGLSGLIPGRFMARGTYHVTLAFLGEIDEAVARAVVGALDEIAPRHGPIGLRPTGLGTFGRPRDCTLWLGIDRTGELAALAGDVRGALDERGVAFDAKPFRPHITLARRASLPATPLEGLVFPADALARRVTLFKSSLASSGAVYKPLYTISLDSGEGPGARSGRLERGR